MAYVSYPVDIRADRPQTSSKMWAVLTILCWCNGRLAAAGSMPSST